MEGVGGWIEAVVASDLVVDKEVFGAWGGIGEGTTPLQVFDDVL